MENQSNRKQKVKKKDRGIWKYREKKDHQVLPLILDLNI